MMNRHSKRVARLIVFRVAALFAVWLEAIFPSPTMAATGDNAQGFKPSGPAPRHQALVALTNGLSVWIQSNRPPVAVFTGANLAIVGTQAGIRLGTSIAEVARSNGTLVALGVPRFKGNPGPEMGGGIFFFQARLEPPYLVPAGMFAPMTPRAAAFGQSLAVTRLSGDSTPLLLAGSPNFRVSQSLEGALFALNTRGPWNTGPIEPLASSGKPSARYGDCVDSAGDVNGDGWDDVIVGARTFKALISQEGAAFLYPGSSNGPARTHTWWTRGEERDDQFGWAVTGAGDVNGDGLADVLVGAPRYSRRKPVGGRAYLYLGSTNGLAEKPSWIGDGPAPFSFFGIKIAALGDIDGDGLSDVLISAPGSNRDPSEWPGTAYVYKGTTNGLSITPSLVLHGERAHSEFGAAVAMAGDLNGDGMPDLVVGAPRFSGVHENGGRTYLFLGRKGGFHHRPAWTLDGDQPGAACGESLKFIRDLNRDGCDELLVGSPRYSAFAGAEGRVDLFAGSRTGYGDAAAFELASLSSHPPGQAEWPASASNSPAGTGAGARPDFIQRPRTWLLGFSALLIGAIVAVAERRRRSAGRRRRKQETSDAITAERQRLARDLHDQLGPHLARLSRLESTRSSNDASQPRQAGDGLAAAEVARDAARALEQAVWAADPGHDSLESLVSFLGSQTEQLTSGTGIRCYFDLPEVLPDSPLSADVRKNILLAGREALANAIKHSCGSSIWVRVRYDAPNLTVQIEDDGRGLPAGEPRRFGNGLKNMRERMQTIGGTCELSALDKGVRVTLHARI